MIKRGRQEGVEIRDMATNPFSCKFFQKKNMKMVLKMFQSNFDKNLVVINKKDKEDIRNNISSKLLGKDKIYTYIYIYIYIAKPLKIEITSSSIQL